MDLKPESNTSNKVKYTGFTEPLSRKPLKFLRDTEALLRHPTVETLVPILPQSLSNKIEAVSDVAEESLNQLAEIDLDKIYSICLQEYHLSNCSDFLNITEEELLNEKCSKVVSTSVQDTLEEYLRNHQNIKPRLENRLVYQ